MTRSDWLIVFLVACGVVVGVIVGQAWPQQAGVTKSVAVFCCLALAVLTFVVLHMRRGRP